MDRKIKKIFLVFVCVLLLFCATCGTVGASNIENVYDGNISSSVIDIYKSIVSDISINDDYVFYRSSQSTYTLICGKISYNNGTFELLGNGDKYLLSTTGTYNSTYSYEVTKITSFELSVSNQLIYSNLGNFPELEGRSEKFEIIQTVILCSACLFVIICSIFNSSKRG